MENDYTEINQFDIECEYQGVESEEVVQYLQINSNTQIDNEFFFDGVEFIQISP